ncbi:hypothetical protein LC609_08455 [Nostoc sp. XA013]|nr:hypothetical protein [Nostoc sp. XA013]
MNYCVVNLHQNEECESEIESASFEFDVSALLLQPRLWTERHWQDIQT